MRILQFGDELELVNDTDREVLVPGYSDEPYLRIGPDGVWRNAHSPATYINLDRYGRTTLPDRADAAADPAWEQVSTEPHYVWHDHRTHWMSENLLPPEVAADPDRSHTVFEWTVPIRHGDTAVEVAGELTWSPPPPALAGVAALRAAVAPRRRRGAAGPHAAAPGGAPARGRRGSAVARRGDPRAAAQRGLAHGGDRLGAAARAAPRRWWPVSGSGRRSGGEGR